jgi:hypothetical protein
VRTNADGAAPDDATGPTPTDGGLPWELRVHGVAGTPPEQLLEATAIELPAELPRGLELHRGRQVPQHRRAFSWGALTSGKKRHAFNVLLLPFMLANVAGWMLPILARPSGDDGTAEPPDDPPTPVVRAAVLLVRLHGFVITAVFALFVALAFLRVLPSLLTTLVDETVGAVLAYLGGVGTLLALGWFTKVHPRDANARLWGEDATPVVDRVGMAWFDRHQDRLWSTPQTAAHLHRAHVCLAIAIVVATSGWAVVRSLSPVVPDLALASLVASALVLVLSITATSVLTWRAGTELPGWWSRLVRTGLPLVTLVAVAAGVAVAPRLPTDPAAQLPAVPAALTLVGAAALVLALLLGMVASRTLPAGITPRQAWNGPWVLLLAAAVGTVFGAGLLTNLLRWGGRVVDDPSVTQRVLASLPTSLEWVALAFTVIAVVLVLLGVSAFVRADGGIGPATPARRMVRLRAVVTPTSTLVTTIGVAGSFGLVALLVAGFTCVDPDRGGRWPATQLQPLADQTCLAPVTNDAVLAWLVGLVLLAVAVAVFGLMAGRLVRYGVGSVLLVLAGGAFVRGVAEVVGWELAWLTEVELPVSLSTAVTTVAFVFPVGLVVGRFVLGGLRDRQTRRGLAVLWDVATFWPRWFHPFAQRSYSDTAVSQLSALLQERAAAVQGPAGSRPEATVLAPHSQGSIIAVPAILHAEQSPTDPDLSGLALLTYGSPLGTLYREVFPAMFPPSLMSAVAQALCPGGGEPAPATAPRWRNLWRRSDPIGGAIWRPDDETRIPDVDALSQEPGDAAPGGLADTWEPSRNHSNYFSEPAYRRALADLWTELLPGAPPLQDPEPQEPKPPGPGPNAPPVGG